MTKIDTSTLTGDEIIGQLNDLLLRCRNVKSRVEALQAYDSPILREYLALAYNPYLRFGVKLSDKQKREIISESEYHGLGCDHPQVKDILKELAKAGAGSATKANYIHTNAKNWTPRAAWVITQVVNKELFPKIGQSIVEKAFPGLTPTFGCQLAAKYTSRKAKFPALVEPKFDGLRAISVVMSSGEVEVTTRTGREIPAAKFFHKELQALGMAAIKVLAASGIETDAVIIDGEICSDTFNESMSIYRASSTATSGDYMVFDVLPIEAFSDKSFVSQSQTVRRGVLRDAVSTTTLTNVKLATSYVANSDHEVREYYTRFVAKGLEGVIVKNPDGIWQAKRTNDWLKIKGEESLDLPIIGAFEGEGEMEGTLGGVILDFNGVEVRVGSGFKLDERHEIWNLFLEDMQRVANSEGDFELLGKIVEVSYQEITPAKSLRHPVYKRMRLDKNEASY